MSRSKATHSSTGLTVVLILIWLSCQSLQGQTQAPADAEQIIISRLVASRGGVPLDYKVLDVWQEKCRGLDRNVWFGKIINSQTGEAIDAFLDEGVVGTDTKALRRSELLARQAKWGRLDPRLANTMSRIKAGTAQDKTPVVIWIASGPPPAPSSSPKFKLEGPHEAEPLPYDGAPIMPPASTVIRTATAAFSTWL